MKIIIGIVGFVFVVFIIAAINGPKTTVDLAHDITATCIENNGDGEWSASMGKLESFCSIKGSLAGIKAACKINPAGC